MLFTPFNDAYLTGESPLTPLQVYNETRYGSLNNLDYRTDIGTFPNQTHSASVNTLAIDRIYNRFLLSGSSDSTIKLWDLDSPKSVKTDGDALLKYSPVHSFPRKSVHNFGVTKLKWWPDNGMFLSSSYDFTMNLYDANSMEVAHSFKLGSRILDFDVHPSGITSTVICCLDGGVGGVKVLDLRTLSDTQTLGGGGVNAGGVGYMSSCSYSPRDPNLCVAGSVDGSCYGWDIRSSEKHLFELDMNVTPSYMDTKQSRPHKRKTLLKCKAHNAGINSMLFTSDGTTLVTLGNDEKLRTWDMCTYSKPVNRSINFGPLIRNKTTQRVDMCVSPSLETEISFLWVPSDSGEILVYRLEDGSLVSRLTRATHTQSNKFGTRSYSVVSSGDNQIRYYSGCKDGNICTWGYDSKTDEHQGSIPFDNGVDIESDL